MRNAHCHPETQGCAKPQYLGKGVVKQLLDDGIEVIATDIRGNLIDAKAQIMIANLFDIKEPYSYFGKPDVLLHMAWRDGFIHSSPNHIDDLPLHNKFLNKVIEWTFLNFPPFSVFLAIFTS